MTFFSFLFRFLLSADHLFIRNIHIDHIRSPTRVFCKTHYKNGLVAGYFVLPEPYLPPLKTPKHGGFTLLRGIFVLCFVLHQAVAIQFVMSFAKDSYLGGGYRQDLAGEFADESARGDAVPRADPPPFILRTEQLKPFPDRWRTTESGGSLMDLLVTLFGPPMKPLAGRTGVYNPKAPSPQGKPQGNHTQPCTNDVNLRGRSCCRLERRIGI